VLGAAPGRAEALELAASFADDAAIESGYVAARDRAAAEIDALQIDATEAAAFAELAGMALSGPEITSEQVTTCEPTPGDLETLAGLGLSPAHPLAVLHANENDPGLVEALVKAAAYWHARGCAIDTLIVAEDDESRDLAAAVAERYGGCCRLRVIDQATLAASAITLIDTVARLVIRDHLPPLGRHRLSWTAPSRPSAGGDRSPRWPMMPPQVHDEEDVDDDPEKGTRLRFDNGLGGFDAEGNEYVIRVDHRGWGRSLLPPRPWVNVIANEQLGCLVSETGAGFTWWRNSREFRLTPWSNDAVLDPPGEAFYLRNEENGEYWSLLPDSELLMGGYEVRHGLGYSTYLGRGGLLERFDHTVTIAVARDDPVRFTRVRITNTNEHRRRISVSADYRLVLGTTVEESSRFVITTPGSEAPVVFARNPLAGPFAGERICAGVAFPSGAETTVNDRRRTAHWTNGATLNDSIGAGHGPCIEQQLVLELEPGGTAELAFLLGAAGNDHDAQALLDRYRDLETVDEAIRTTRAFWSESASNVTVETPSPALDLMVNHWLPYQIIGCRLWARSAFYQSGGAFGFRDQLQDAAALVHALPELTRAQILRHAAQQFPEGDVLHWWHPPHGAGIRTRFADDRLWLPYLTADYLRATGDHAILDEPVRGVEARRLEPGEDEAYLQPEPSTEIVDLYERCCRALDCSLTRGEHGLPLFGTGDWNDGMNRVGREGRGESVWLGFFTDAAISEFLPFCKQRGDDQRVRRYEEYRAALRLALNDAGWDGAWYRRAYYDDGTPMGSSTSDECRIDGLVQAWSVLSGVAPRDRAEQAMRAVETHLVVEEQRLIRLLTPPFESTPHDPGYIKGYVRGVRENGGQYTHAALWMVQAMFELGERDKAAKWLDLLNPILRSQTSRQVQTYQLEPYVLAGDVYGELPHVGRGGWSWYTGAAGWMLRVALESLLGIRLDAGTHLVLAPRVPDSWPGFTVDYRLPGTETVYAIIARHLGTDAADGVVAATLDGAPLPVADGACRVPLERDGSMHCVQLELGPRDAP
jgi:cyclic beta-1,2-glucan synthetase